MHDCLRRRSNSGQHPAIMPVTELYLEGKLPSALRHRPFSAAAPHENEGLEVLIRIGLAEGITGGSRVQFRPKRSGRMTRFELNRLSELSGQGGERVVHSRSARREF
jgi:hypothetical protein